ncbi:MAG: hypothetical protein JNK89_01415 [Saprospiraceae bacterium]|nr:hypothetical protein [Saprospiraceae bacterium]
MPNVQRKDIDSTSALITVTLTKADLKPKIDSELKRIRNRATIKGFRHGQAPMEYIKRMFGTSVFGDSLNEMLSEHLYNYLRDSKLDVLGQPLPTENQQRYSFKIDQMEDEYAIEYEVGFVPLFDIQGLSKDQSYERLTVSNLNELAENDLEYARKRMGKRSNPETDIQEKDMLRIAARELDGAEIKAGGWETTITILVETISDAALKNDFLAAKKGDTLRFNARLLDMGDDEERFRKYILNLPENDDRTVGDSFEGLIEEVSRVEIADLDEEFFTNYFGGGVNNTEEALDQIKQGIVRFYDIRANALLMRAFQTRLLELNRFELPNAFLKRWLGLNNEELSPEKIEAEYPAFAENLRWSILRDRLKEQFGIEVTDEEVREEYVKKVRNYFQAQLPDHIIDSSVARLMENKKDVEETVRDLETDKLFQAIRNEVTITEKAIPSEEFHQILDAVTKKAESEQQEGIALGEAAE